MSDRLSLLAWLRMASYSDPGNPRRVHAAAQQTSRTVTLSRRPSCGADSLPRRCVRRRDQAENIAVRVLEPCGFHRSGHMKIALPGQVRQVVMLEGNASALQGPHEIVDLFGDERHRRRRAGSGVLS